MTRASYLHIVDLTYEPRPDYGRDVEAAWSHDLDALIDWECTSSICDPDENEVEDYLGWAKWQRIERRISSGELLSATIECGHCGTEYDVTSEL